MKYRMRDGNIFYSLYVSTILAIRLEVFLFPTNKLMVGNAIIHHFWVGMVLIAFVFLLPKSYTLAKIILLSVGFGLVADQLVFISLGGGTVGDYWSVYSVAGVIVLTAAIFAIRNWLTRISIKTDAS